MIFKTANSTNAEFANMTILETKTFYTASSTFSCFASVLNRDKIGTPEQYCLIELDATTANQTTPTKAYYFPHQPQGLIKTVREVNSNGYSQLLFMQQGLLWKYDTTSRTLTVKGDGFKAVDEEAWLNCNMVIDSNTRYYGSSNTGNYVNTDIIYGVSSPAPPVWTQEAPAQGRYSLFKYDTNVCLRVPLADFKDLKVWDALSLLAQKADHVIGFVGRNFWFVPRNYVDPRKDIPDMTLSYDESDENNDILDIGDINFGESDIINVCKIKPYKVKLNEPELSFIFKTRNTNVNTGTNSPEYDPNVQITVNQRDTRRKNIKLSCVTGGFISQGHDNSGQTISNGKPVRFRYIITEPVWETTLYTATTIDSIASSGYIYITVPSYPNFTNRGFRYCR
jgi:hypothetical protein